MKKELEKILEDQKFVEKIISMETKEEAKKAIEEKGVSVTDEEMNEIHDLYSAVYEECKKMKKEDLEKIAGGKKGVLQRLGEWWHGDSISQFTGGVTDTEEAKNRVGKAVEKLEEIVDANLEERRMGAKANLLAQRNEKERLKNAAAQTALDAANSERLYKLGEGALVVACVGGVLHVFRDDIKSWVRKLG